MKKKKSLSDYYKNKKQASEYLYQYITKLEGELSKKHECLVKKLTPDARKERLVALDNLEKEYAAFRWLQAELNKLPKSTK